MRGQARSEPVQQIQLLASLEPAASKVVDKLEVNKLEVNRVAVKLAASKVVVKLEANRVVVKLAANRVVLSNPAVKRAVFSLAAVSNPAVSNPAVSSLVAKKVEASSEAVKCQGQAQVDALPVVLWVGLAEWAADVLL